MSGEDPNDTKRSALAQMGMLHPKPDLVSDELFLSNPFFDPNDVLQVKYEMLRRVRIDGHTASQAAAACGLSRPTYYQTRDAFERAGIVGLLPQKKGPKRAHKLTPEVLAFVDELLATEPGLTPVELAARIRDEHGVDVHPKSIPRARRLAKKKTASPRKRTGSRPKR